MTVSISVSGLSKAFGKYHIINNVSLSVGPGTVYGLVGLNGAGKTTLLRLLLGILKPDRGTITVSGHTPWQHPEALYRKCGVVLENDGFWGNLSAIENCRIYASAKGISGESLTGYLDTFWKRSDLFSGNKKVKHFSRGQRMQCALCRAFMGTPSVLFLDEPALALDLPAYDHFKQLVAHVRANGAAVIISSHQLDTIDELCDRVGILRDGLITELDTLKKNSGSRWYLDTDNKAAVEELIARSGGENILFDNSWYFSVATPRETIPRLIRQLVEHGYPVREIKEVEPGFGAAIRTLYAGAAAKEQS